MGHRRPVGRSRFPKRGALAAYASPAFASPSARPVTSARYRAERGINVDNQLRPLRLPYVHVPTRPVDLGNSRPSFFYAPSVSRRAIARQRGSRRKLPLGRDGNDARRREPLRGRSGIGLGRLAGTYTHGGQLFRARYRLRGDGRSGDAQSAGAFGLGNRPTERRRGTWVISALA